MREPEEVARELAYFKDPTGPHLCPDEEDNWPRIIRERDAEVRAETPAEFTWETPTGAIRAGSRAPHGRTRRLVGPWQPDTRTPEQRSADALDDLKRRLGETP